VAFAYVGLNWEDHVESSEQLMRPTEIKDLKGDYSLARKELGWEPRTTFEQLMQLMVDADLQRFKA
jgi:GDPmannose 4,6-dehydratase